MTSPNSPAAKEVGHTPTLKPCPFCRSPALLYQASNDSGWWLVVCSDGMDDAQQACRARPEVQEENRELAIAHWNHREDDSHDALVAERDALLAAKATQTPSTLSVRKHPDPLCSVRYVMENGEELATCYGDDEAATANRIVAALELANAHSALLTRVSELEAGLQKCVAIIEDMDEAMPMDAGCIQCTAGTVPNNRNTGLCGYHAAKGLLEPRT